MRPGQVTGIFITPAEGAAAAPVDEVKAVEGMGLEGDRYAARAGKWSEKPATGREVTFIDAAAAREAGLEPGESRRNVEVTGVDLLSLVGRQFAVGDVVLRGDRDCPPCGYLQGLTHEGVVAALQGKGGLRATIVNGGIMRVGDTVRAL